jgi:hypothetical protein
MCINVTVGFQHIKEYAEDRYRRGEAERRVFATPHWDFTKKDRVYSCNYPSNVCHKMAWGKFVHLCCNMRQQSLHSEICNLLFRKVYLPGRRKDEQLI